MVTQGIPNNPAVAQEQERQMAPVWFPEVDGPPPDGGDDEGNLEPDIPDGLEQAVRERYPQLAPFLNIPEIANLLLNGQEDGWGPEEFRAAFIQTDWYLSNSESYRNAYALQINDPATYQDEVNGRYLEARNLARSAGLTFGEDVLRTAAENSLLFAWSEDEMLDFLASQVDLSDGFSPGALSELSNSIQTQARDFHMRYDDDQSNRMALDIWSGRLSEDAAISMFRDRARERYTWMGDWLDRGGTVEQYFNPLKNEVANQLEIGVEDIDLIDPKWMELVEIIDGDTGQRRARTLTEGITWARKQDQYKNTTNYSNSTLAISGALGRVFGRSPI